MGARTAMLQRSSDLNRLEEPPTSLPVPARRLYWLYARKAVVDGGALKAHSEPTRFPFLPLRSLCFR